MLQLIKSWLSEIISRFLRSNPGIDIHSVERSVDRDIHRGRELVEIIIINSKYIVSTKKIKLESLFLFSFYLWKTL